MQTVIEHITSYSIAETVEEVGADCNGSHIEPCLVVNEVSKLPERELLCTLWLETFLCEESTSQCHHGSNDTEYGTNDSILMSSIS